MDFYAGARGRAGRGRPTSRARAEYALMSQTKEPVYKLGEKDLDFGDDA